jgi:DNA-binding transcriptional regulator YdaS (Cro superfamily)
LPTVYARALKRAAEIVGGKEQLALHLNVVPSHLALWMDGAQPTPQHIFLKAVDLISESEQESLKKRPH